MLQQKIKISIVSYLNSKPFLYGLYRNDIDQIADLSLDIPSACAQKLISGQVDLGLIPVAAIPLVPHATIVSDYCIGAVGAVKTVAIYAKQPLEQLETIYLDYQSRSSVALTRILLQEYWQCSPLLIPATADYIEHIGGTTGAVIIGDRTIALQDHFPYVYDLAEAWYQWKGLPFVFAAWVSNKALPQEFLSLFNAALSDGLQRISQVAALFASSHPGFDVEQYYRQYISYSLDAPKKQALSMFLDYIERD